MPKKPKACEDLAVGLGYIDSINDPVNAVALQSPLTSALR